MTVRTRALAALAALIVLLTAVAAGCTDLQGFTSTADGKLTKSQGNDTWSWEKRGSAALVGLNGKTFATLERGVAVITLADGRTFDVVLTNTGAPATVRVPWGTALTQADYDLMATAFKVNTDARGLPLGTPWGWILILVLLMLAGVGLSLFAGRVVESARGGGILGFGDTAKSLLIFRVVGVVIAGVSLIVLIAVAAR